MPSRYGAGELYGFDFSALPSERIRQLSSAPNWEVQCPFKPVEPGKPGRRWCNKKGGVCSLRLFVQDKRDPVSVKGDPVVTCPNRFLEADLVIQWVGETLLGTDKPKVISELPFLMGDIQKEEEETATDAVDKAEAVGKIDKVLVNANGESLRWCALEMQALYFSGKSIENDFKIMRTWRRN